jgi:DNA-binding IclR family transcriptional regulator
LSLEQERDAVSEIDGKHGVQSLEIGMRVLQVIVNGHRAMALKDIAALAHMSAAKAHRYLVSLVRTGMVEQDPLTSRYDLGPLAMTLGLVAADRQDAVRLGLSAVAKLCAEINEAVALIAWSRNGPIVVRLERPRRAVTVSVDMGTALNMVTTASGRIFGAYLPPTIYEPLVKKALASSSVPEGLRSRHAVMNLYDDLRKAGLAIVEGDHLVPGVAAMAVPVFNSNKDIALAITVVGIRGALNTDPSGALASTLKAAANELSQRLGYQWGSAQPVALYPKAESPKGSRRNATRPANKGRSAHR